MFFKKKKSAKTNLQDLIDIAQAHLATIDLDSPEYKKAFNKLEKLYKLQSLEKTTGFHVSPDTLVAAAASILGIIIIVAYEHAHTITSKSVSLLPRNRI